MGVKSNEPFVWIGCLACRNAGKLVGDWYPANEAGDITPDDIHGRPIAPETHEELWCFDIENLPISHEIDPLEAQRWGDLYDEVGDVQWPAFSAWVRSGAHVTDGEDMPSTSDFAECYCGEWESWRDYVSDLIESTGMQEGWPQTAIDYFNTEQFARDLEADFTVYHYPGGIFVFRDF